MFGRRLLGLAAQSGQERRTDCRNGSEMHDKGCLHTALPRWGVSAACLLCNWILQAPISNAALLAGALENLIEIFVERECGSSISDLSPEISKGVDSSTRKSTNVNSAATRIAVIVERGIVMPFLLMVKWVATQPHFLGCDIARLLIWPTKCDGLQGQGSGEWSPCATERGTAVAQRVSGHTALPAMHHAAYGRQLHRQPYSPGYTDFTTLRRAQCTQYQAGQNATSTQVRQTSVCIVELVKSGQGRGRLHLHNRRAHITASRCDRQKVA